MAAELKKVLGVSGELDPRIFQRSYNGEFSGLNQGMIEASYYRKFRGFSDDRPFSEMPPEINEINERYKKERETAYEAIANKHSERLKALQAENEKAEQALRIVSGDSARHYSDEQARNILKVCDLKNKYAKNIAFQVFGGIGDRSVKDVEKFMKKTEIDFSSTLEMIKTEKGWMAS